MLDHIRTDNITTYMKEVESFPRISHERERELYNIMHGEDKVAAEEARTELITANLRLVVKLSHDYKQFGQAFSDIVQEGNLGLVIAADKFNPDICPKFSVVAAWWIKQRIRKSILSQTRTVRIPDGAAQLASRVAKTRHSYEAMFGELPTNEEVAEILGVSVRRIEGAAIADVNICSMDEQVNEDSKTTFEEMLIETIDDTNDEPEDMDEAVCDLNRLVEKLPAKDKFLLKNSYGFGCVAQPIEILAQETGMSPRCIRGRLHSIYQHLYEVLKDKQYDF